MVQGGVAQDGELRLTQSVAASKAGAQPRIVRDHRVPRDRIADWPEAHHERFGAGEHKRSPKSVDTLAAANFAHTRIARRQCDETGPPEVETRGFERRQNAVSMRVPSQVRTGERQS